MPKLVRKPDTSKTITTQPGEIVAEIPLGTSADKSPQKDKGKRKEKGDLAGSVGFNKKPGKASAEDDGEPVPSMIDLRVGRIVDSQAASLPCKAYLESVRSSHETSRCRQSVC